MVKWFLKYRSHIIWAAIVIATLVAAQCQRDASLRALGAAIERNAILSDSLSIVKARGRAIDTVFRRDTVRLVRRLETVTTLLDTLRLSDTVTLTRRESVLVFVADSLVQNCRDTLTSCSARIGNLQEQLSLTSAQRDLWRRQAQPSLWQQLKQIPQRAITATALASVGYAACKLTGGS